MQDNGNHGDRVNCDRTIKMWQVLRNMRMGENEECRRHEDEIKSWVFCKDAWEKGGLKEI